MQKYLISGHLGIVRGLGQEPDSRDQVEIKEQFHAESQNDAIKQK